MSPANINSQKEKPQGLEHQNTPTSTVLSVRIQDCISAHTLITKFPALNFNELQQTKIFNQNIPNISHETTRGNWGRMMVTTSNFPVAKFHYIILWRSLITHHRLRLTHRPQIRVLEPYLADLSDLVRQRITKEVVMLIYQLRNTEVGRIDTSINNGLSRMKYNRQLPQTYLPGMFITTWEKSLTEVREIG